jgi:hypothetical protein
MIECLSGCYMTVKAHDARTTHNHAAGCWVAGIITDIGGAIAASLLPPAPPDSPALHQVVFGDLHVACGPVSVLTRAD